MNGIANFLKLWYDKTGNMNVNGITYPVSLRPNMYDKYTFKEMFVLKHYDIHMHSAWLPPAVIVDASANIGLSSVFFANNIPAQKYLP